MLKQPEMDHYGRVHFVGIGGIGMLALAQYLVASGVTISGSDLQDSDALEDLKRRNVPVYRGHVGEHVKDADLVVVTSAASKTNPEVVEAQRRGIKVIRRAELLGQISAAGTSIAVAGTHGKSTTTALAGHLLRQTGTDVSVLGGGFIRDESDKIVGPALVGESQLFVVEADEYDRSFLVLHPTMAIITGIEFDHPDCYPSLNNMIEAYSRFAGQVTGSLIVAGGSPAAISVAQESGRQFETYGVDGDFDWTATAVEPSAAGSSFRITHHAEDLGLFQINIPGMHNAHNSVAALAAATAFTGQPASTFREAFSGFSGVVRRLEVRGTVGGVTVIDDYAHHPTEITAAVEALRVEDGRLWILFQPHTFTRTQALFDDFVESLSGADEVVLIDVYAAREDPIPGVTSEKLTQALRANGVNAIYTPNHDLAVSYVTSIATAGDIIITMGAGDVGKLPERIISALKASSHTHTHSGMNSSTEIQPSPRNDGHNSMRQDFLAELRDRGLSRIREGEPMSGHTSWRVGGAADIFAIATTSEKLISAITLARANGMPCLVLGGGSNILVSDDGIEGLVILNRIRDLSIRDGGNHVEVEAGSGVFFARLALFAASSGLAGLEWGVAIPGTVGAGVVNNSGAHHGDVERALLRAEAIDSQGRSKSLTPDELRFGYRQSALKPINGSPITQTDTVITRCWFGAQPDPQAQSGHLKEELMAQRLATQPIEEATAGSTFKNPTQGSAAAYIEQAGLKGTTIGGAQVSLKHANFVVNTGSATAADIVQLIHLIRSTVQQRFGIELEPEVQVVGRWNEAYPLNIPSPPTGAI